jgi:hypothetical protein
MTVRTDHNGQEPAGPMAITPGKFSRGILRPCYEHHAKSRGHNIEIAVSKFEFLNGTLIVAISDQGDGASTGDGGQFRCPFSKDGVTGLAGA